MNDVHQIEGQTTAAEAQPIDGAGQGGKTEKPASPGKPGRPVIFDEARQKLCCQLVAAGWSKRRAAKVLGISPSTIQQLAARDLTFRRRLLESEMSYVPSPEDVIRRAARRSWRAAAWLAERQLAGPRVRPIRKVMQEILNAMNKDSEQAR